MSLFMSHRFWLFLLSIILFIVPPSFSQQNENLRPLRIVLTNDDGVEDLEDRLIPLARALAPFAEVYIVVSSRDRSGSTNYSSIGKEKRTLESEFIYKQEKTSESHLVEVHVVEGFPADCVSLAVKGILRDAPPDLVISGINGGPNLGEAWSGSGTIGAARAAAFFGIPALAVSGINDKLDGSVEAATRWIAKLVQSQLVQNLEPGQYLTIGLPRTEPSKIKGIRIAKRSQSLGNGHFEPVGVVNGEDGKRTIWLAHPAPRHLRPSEESDIALYQKGYIIITPMHIDEHDNEMLSYLKTHHSMLPAWNAN